MDSPLALKDLCWLYLITQFRAAAMFEFRNSTLLKHSGQLPGAEPRPLGEIKAKIMLFAFLDVDGNAFVDGECFRMKDMFPWINDMTIIAAVDQTGNFYTVIHDGGKIAGGYKSFQAIKIDN